MITYISPKARYIEFESMTVATILELFCPTQKNGISSQGISGICSLYICFNKTAKDEYVFTD